MENVLRLIKCGVWHTTSRERFESICRDGEIRAEPNIHDSERWSTRSGPRYFPYVRSLGGISLFDFSEFEAKTYNEKYRLSNWDEFVPFRQDWGSAVWIKINRVSVEKNLIAPDRLLARWNIDGGGRRIMPMIGISRCQPRLRSSSLISSAKKSKYLNVAKMARLSKTPITTQSFLIF